MPQLVSQVSERSGIIRETVTSDRAVIFIALRIVSEGMKYGVMMQIWSRALVMAVK